MANSWFLPYFHRTCILIKTISWIILLKTNRLYVQFNDDIDNLKNSTHFIALWNEIKNWIELNWYIWRKHSVAEPAFKVSFDQIMPHSNRARRDKYVQMFSLGRVNFYRLYAAACVPMHGALSAYILKFEARGFCACNVCALCTPWLHNIWYGSKAPA